MGLTSSEEGGDGGVFICYYTKVEGDWPVMVKSLLVSEDGDVNPEDIEFSSALILLEGVGGEDEEDKHEAFERSEFLELVAVLPLVLVKGSNLVCDLVSVFVRLVDVIGECGVLWEEIDNKLKGVGFEGVL